MLFLSDEKREFNYAFNSLESFSKNLDIDNQLIDNAYQEYLEEIQIEQSKQNLTYYVSKSNDDVVKIAQDVYKDLMNGVIDFTEAVKNTAMMKLQSKQQVILVIQAVMLFLKNLKMQ